MSHIISIVSIASLSPLGNSKETIWKNYLTNEHCFVTKEFSNQQAYVAVLDSDCDREIEQLQQFDFKYKSLDHSVLYALAASRRAFVQSGWNENDIFGVNIGSSRGATELFEKHHQEFLETGKAQTLASPTTTLGNISSWVSHDLQSQGPEISHSITCSTALHALLNGVAWLRSGMASKFLVGGSEAPLTDFTIAQMKALKIYASVNGEGQNQWPCRALDLEKEINTLILGEGAAVCCLEMGKSERALAFIEGVGYATEILEHNISISTEAICFQKSMKMALKDTEISDVDVIVMHAPGTKAGDITEYKAIQKVFGDDLPMLTTNKWKIGHTFGASGMLNVEMAILMMQYQQFIGVPFASIQQSNRKSIKKVLINAVGFGGNAVSILLSKD